MRPCGSPVKRVLDGPKGRNYDLSLTNTMQISYYKRTTREVTAYLATAGDAQVTRANRDSLTFQFKNVVFRERGDATSRIVLTLNGPLVVNKGEFVIEPDASFEAHAFGFGPNAK